jgi:hypothetical protein
MTGPGCSLQGYLLNSGDVSSSIWSFVIALHCFALLAGGPKWRAWVADKTASGKLRWIVCAGIWTFVYGLSAIGPVFLQNLHPENGPFCIIPTMYFLANKDDQFGPGWCWISAGYALERIYFHYRMSQSEFD